MVKDRSKVIKRMVELMRSGAVMLDQQCPICGSPLFRLRSGEIACPIHGSVRVVRSESEAIEAMSEAILDEVEQLASRKLHELVVALESGDVNVAECVDSLIKWLSVLRLCREVKNLKHGREGGKERRK